MKQPLDDQVMTRYLLGSLPAAETERLDELGLTDDEFAAALEAAENDLVDSYVRGKLGGAALEQFNSHYLASPRRRERVAFAQALRVFGEREADVAGAAPQRNFFRHLAGSFPRLMPRPLLQWGLAAATLVLLAAGGWLVFENARLRRQVSETEARRADLGRREEELRRELAGERTANSASAQELARVRAERERLEQQLKEEETRPQRPSEERAAPARSPAGEARVAAFVLTPQLRGAGQLASISIPPQTDRVMMRLELEPHEYPAYRVRLLDPSGQQTLWQSGRLRARSTGGRKTLSVSLRAELLTPRVYVLQVAGLENNGSAEIVGDYSFRVMK